MLGFCLLLLAGACLVNRLPGLPPASLWPLGLLACLWLAGRRRWRVAAVVAGGGLLAWGAGLAALVDRLPHGARAGEFTFDAQVIEFTQKTVGSSRLLVAPDGGSGLPERLRLSDYEPAREPLLGERWRFRARLRLPRGFRNPGGFDYAGFLHRERVGASGYVLEAERLASAEAGVSRGRQAAVARVESLLPPGAATAALLAISSGARHRVSADAWERYAASGTTHLMAISGLHVGLAATAFTLLAWAVFAVAGRRWRLREWALLAGLTAATAYVLFAGMALPARRAAAMAVLGACLVFSRRPVHWPAVVALLAVVMVMAEPLALLQPGFGLSFGAVAVLLYAGRLRVISAGVLRRGLLRLWQVQAALLVGLFPLLAGYFDRVSLVAPLANAVVLPVFSLVTVPAALLGTLLDGPLSAAGDGLLRLAWHSLRACEAVIARLAALPAASLALAEPAGMARALFLLPVLALLPPASPGRRLGWLALAAACLYRPPAIAEGCAELHTLDVGQGLAQVVRTAGQVLVFDTGPAYRGGGSSARSVLIPFLESAGVRKIDVLVVSHGDQDHAGGVADLVRAFPVISAYAGEKIDGLTALPCRAGMAWRRDGIGFRFLHPAAGSAQGNDASCVLEVRAGGHAALLTGDIERGAELDLLARNAPARQAWVSVPHHGSRTSSSAAFIAATRPAAAVVSAGHGNRWGFPKPDIVRRWQTSGADVFTTAGSGAITHRLCRDRGLQLGDEYRRSARRYWHRFDD